MRLINIETLDLEEFIGEPPPYAILSHTWGQEEVSFQEYNWLREQQKELEEDPEIRDEIGPRRFARLERKMKSIQEKAGFRKILGCVNLVIEDLKFRLEFRSTRTESASSEDSGYEESNDIKYLWVDTCCIDKTSSAELSEAINSMYSWYHDSSWCIVYLEDVTSTEENYSISQASQFGRSRWFTRGWTLQELLAPEEPAFYNRHWKLIGNRSNLSKVISTVTGIYEYHLRIRRLAPPSQTDVISWAAKRTTTRIEDLSYSLLGLVDVNMPLLYGEGSRAFHRLQLQILSQTKDLTILAWGYRSGLESLKIGLFASTPSNYDNCSHFRTESSPHVRRSLGNLLATDRSIQVSLPLLEIPSTDWTPSVCCALLPCYAGTTWLALILELHLDHNESIQNGSQPLIATRLGVTGIARRDSWIHYSDVGPKTLSLIEGYSSSPLHGVRFKCGLCWDRKSGLCCTEAFPPFYSKAVYNYDSKYLIDVSWKGDDRLVFFVLQHDPLGAKIYQDKAAVIIVLQCLLKRSDKIEVTFKRFRLLALYPLLEGYSSLTDLFLHKPSRLDPVYWFDSPFPGSYPCTSAMSDTFLSKPTSYKAVVDFDAYVHFLNENGHEHITKALGLQGI